MGFDQISSFPMVVELGIAVVDGAHDILFAVDDSFSHAACSGCSGSTSGTAEFERDLIQERTQAGLKAARTRGRMGGRPSLLDNRQINRMIEMYDAQKNTVAEICKIYNISHPSFYNYLKQNKSKEVK